MRYLALLSLLAISQVYGNVIDDIMNRRQLELADAYWLAGERYIELNKTEIGRAMQARARQLVPGYQPPSERQMDGVPSLTPAPVEVALPQISQEEIARRAAEGRRIVRIQFNRLVRGFLMEEISTISSGLAERIEVPEVGNLSRNEATRRLQELFQDAEVDGLGIEDLYNPDTIQVEQVEGTTDDYVLTVNLSSNAPDYLQRRPWWAPSLSLYFVRSGNNWVLRAVSKN